ncbi:M1 family aminopeptidase [Cupriavidus basilensis]
MAHPVRPDSYEEINNFYTVTVYEKGAEVVRMYQTLLGRDGFRKGMDLYFKRHDGQAVTCDDFPRRDGRRQWPRPHAVRPLVQPGRHAGGHRAHDVECR